MSAEVTPGFADCPVAVSWEGADGDSGDAWWPSQPATQQAAVLRAIDELRPCTPVRVEQSVGGGTIINVTGADASAIDRVNEAVVAILGEPAGVA